VAKIIIPVISICLLVGYGGARAEEDWVLYGISKYLIFYYNSKSVTYPSHDIVTLWIKTVSKCNDDRDWEIKNHPNCAKADFEYVLTLIQID